MKLLVLRNTLDMSNSTYMNVTLLTASKRAEQKLFLCCLVGFFFLFKCM